MWALGTANASAGLFAPRDWNCFVLERILMVMRQKSWFRTLATVLAVWFPLIVGEPGVLHLCPAHGGTAPVAAAMAHHHGASHGSQPGHDHHDCTCISCCVGSVVTPPAPIAPTTVFVEAIRDGGIAHPAVASPARRAPEYSRPYTTGPPRA
jgi:hypothetical protein